MWKPVVMTSITTAIGFVSLLTSQVYPIKYFGIFTATGQLRRVRRSNSNRSHADLSGRTAETEHRQRESERISSLGGGKRRNQHDPIQSWSIGVDC